MGLKGFIYFIKFKVEDDYFEYQFVKFQILEMMMILFVLVYMYFYGQNIYNALY